MGVGLGVGVGEAGKEAEVYICEEGRCYGLLCCICNGNILFNPMRSLLSDISMQKPCWPSGKATA